MKMNSRYVLLFFVVQLLTPIRRTIEKDIPLEFQWDIFYLTFHAPHFFHCIEQNRKNGQKFRSCLIFFAE
jgi:hypothetical protein